MSKEFSLTLSERTTALKLTNEFKGGLEILAVLLDDVKLLSIKPEEWEAAGLTKKPVKGPNGEDQESWSWKDEGTEKPVTLQEKTSDWLSTRIKEKSAAGELSMADAGVLSLDKKLKA